VTDDVVIIGFASVENFGLIVRQRSLVLPFLFVILAAASRGAARTDDAATSHPLRTARQ
jgi:hypothetical protein